MSQAPPEATNLNLPNPGTGSHHYPPQSAQTQASAPNSSRFIDGSGPILSMYLERAKEFDEKMVENWKADADAILIFTGLFSAAVASLISVSIQDIQQNPQDTSNFYLANIYQATISDPNRLNISTPSSPPPFTPPNYALWVNGLWFLSLIMSITCALLATLLQQWARRYYLRVTQPRLSLHKQARIHSFFAEGIEKSSLMYVAGALPTLLHISLFLFFAGFVVFLWNFTSTPYVMATFWVYGCALFYGCITSVPLLRHNSPYYTPLTPFAWRISDMIRAYLLLLRGRSPFPRPDNSTPSFEEAILELAPDIDARAFMWTFDSLEEDHELERFFSSLPDYRSSQLVPDPLPGLTQEEKTRISNGLTRFLRYTLSSDLLSEAVKSQRAITCVKALDPDRFSPEYVNRLHENIFRGFRGPDGTNFSRIANDSRTVFLHAVATVFAASPRRRDDSWFRQVAPDALGIPETVLRNYAANGNSLSLAILIHVSRQQFTYLHHESWPEDRFRRVLKASSEFNVQDTSPELQHEFCTLWNEMVFKAQNDNDRMIVEHILMPLREVYLTLHPGADSAPTRFFADTSYLDAILEDPFPYPVCAVADHVHDNFAPTSFARTSPHNDTAPSLASPNMPSLDNFHPAQTTTEGLHIPLSTASVMRDIDASVMPMPHPTSDSFTPAPIPSSHPADSVTLPSSADALRCPDSRNLPYPASSSPVLDHMNRTVSTSPSASPRMTFSHDRAIHVNVMADLDPQLQPPARISTAESNVVIAGTSREPTVERTGDYPYDVV